MLPPSRTTFNRPPHTHLRTVTTMAKFADLSNELVIAIASHIRKPADILQLCIAERRSHKIIMPLLYENIVLHYLDYSPRELFSLNSNISSLCNLFNKQQQNSKTGNDQNPEFGAECRSLSINMLNGRRCPTTSVLELLSFLPFLRNLSLIINRRPLGYRPDFTYEIGRLERALHALRYTLENLTLSIGRYEGSCRQPGIGSMHQFKAMKQLRIQSLVLIGWHYANDITWNPNVDLGLLLSQLLPPNLEKVDIHCCEVEWMLGEGEIGHHFEEAALENSARSFGSSQHLAGRHRRVIDSVVVCTLQEPKTPYSSFIAASRSSRLESCFDIVGRNMDSADKI